MVLYSIIMVVAAVPTLIISMEIYRGKTNLIHDYHQTKVTDKSAYGKSFGKAMFVIAISLLLSGIIGLFGDSETIAMIAVSALLAGLFVGIACIIAVQKKYNKGICKSLSSMSNLHHKISNSKPCIFKNMIIFLTKPFFKIIILKIFLISYESVY